MSNFASKHIKNIWDQIDFHSKSFSEILDELSYEDIWHQEFKDTNPVGNLTLHLTGNLNHRIGVGDWQSYHYSCFTFQLSCRTSSN